MKLVALGAATVLVAALGGCRRGGSAGDLERARTAMRQARFEEALATADRGLRFWGSRPDSVEAWRFRLLKAEVLLSQGRAKEAAPLLQPSPPPGREFSGIAARRLMCNGWMHYFTARYAEAREELAQAFAAALSSKDELFGAEVDLRRAIVLVRLGDSAGATAACRRALRAGAAAGDPYIQAAAYGNLGFQALNSFRYDEAVRYLKTAEPLSEKAQAHKFLVSIAGNIGRCYLVLGEVEAAVSQFERAAAGAARLGDVNGEQMWLGSLGDAYAQAGNRQKALEYYDRAIARSRGLGDPYSLVFWLNSAALTAAEAGDLATAERFNREALEKAAGAGAGNELWTKLAAAEIQLRRGSVAAADRGYREVIAAGPEGDNRRAAVRAYFGLARSSRAAGHAEEADGRFRQAIQAYDQARGQIGRDEWRISFHATAMQVYREYVAFLMEQGRTERAIEIAEWSRARALADKLGVEDGGEPVTVADLRASAARLGAALVSYWVTPDKSWVWVVDAAGVHAFGIPGEAELARTVQSYANAIQAGRDPLRMENDAGEWLSGTLLGPVRGLLRPGDRVIVVPDGPLHLLNLETLPAGVGRPKYWIEETTIAIAPSLALLAASGRAHGPGPDAMLIVGDPKPPDEPALPEAGREIEQITRALGATRVTAYTGAAATPALYQNVRPERYRFIHFAAHAVSNRESPLDSAVILSEADGRHKLYARDVLDHPTQARLVTLSACRSAGARAYAGEGLVGFAWAFLRAGAENVVGGLWDVNDASTSALMERFYQRLAAGAAPADALRDAKLSLIAGGGAWAKPYYWAPFEIFSRSMPFQVKRSAAAVH